MVCAAEETRRNQGGGMQRANERSRNVIVIGSGASGMTAAILFARNGYRVKVLEQHAVAGGLMQTYFRGGRELPTGVHCLGGLDEGAVLWRYFKYLGVMDRVAFRRISDDCIAEYRFPSFTFHMPGRRDLFKQRLCESFPDQLAAIHQFFADMQACVDCFPLYQCRYEEAETISPKLTISVAAYLDRLTNEPKLRSILAGNVLLTGMRADECPVYVHMVTTDSFLHGTYRVEPGQRGLISGFVEALKDIGGEIHCRSHVQNIVCDDGRVQGVQVNGSFIPADVVVYTGHPSFLPDLCLSDRIRPTYRQRLREMENTDGVFTLSAKWQHDQCPARDHDVYLYEVDRPWLAAGADKPSWDTAPGIYCTAHASADSQGHTLSTIIPIELARWHGSWTGAAGQRSADYSNAKAQLADYVMTRLGRAWPHMRDRLQIIDTNTPITFNRYTLTPDGSAYGIKRSAGRLIQTRISPATKIGNLFLAGQSIVLSGILGAVISGVLVGALVLDGDDLLARIRLETS